MNLFRFRHIRTSLTVVVVFLISFGFVSLSYVGYRSSRRVIEDSIGLVTEQIIDSVEIKLEAYLSLPHRIDTSIQNMVNVFPDIVANREKLQRLFIELLDQYPEASLVALGHDDGEYEEAQRLDTGEIRVGEAGDSTGGDLELWFVDENLEKSRLGQRVQDYDPRVRPWYTSAASRQGPAWSPVYAYKSNSELAISGNQPFLDTQGAFAGVLTTSFTLRGISDFLEHVRVSSTGRILIFERGGDLIASSYGESLLEGENRRSIHDVESDAVVTAYEHYLGMDTSPENTRAFTVITGAGRQYVRTLEIDSHAGLAWTVMVLIPMSDFAYVLQDSIFRGAMLLVVVLGVTLGLSLLITDRISSPISLMSRILSSLAYGEWHEGKSRIPQQLRNRRDELGQLVEAFEEMLDRLESESQKAQESERQYRELVESANSIILRLDSAGIVTFCNSFGLDFFGYAKDEFVGRDEHETIIPARDSLGRDQSHVIRELYSSGTGRSIRENENQKKNGERVWILWANQPLLDEKGEIREILSVGHDITEKRRLELAVRANLEEKELLIKEIHHRAKNNLQLISSLLSIQGRKLKDPEIRETFHVIQSRIYSMSSFHEQLYREPGGANVEFKDYADHLVPEVFSSYADPNKEIRLDYICADLKVPASQCLSFGLILTELITNAQKHAFTNIEKGVLTVRISRRGEGIRLEVSDTGLGIDPEVFGPGSEGVGYQLVDALLNQVAGSLDISTEGGTTFRIDAPLAADGVDDHG